MLTGDKLETAESIGFSSKLLTPEMQITRCRDINDMKAAFNQEKSDANQRAIENGVKRAIIIETGALSHVLKSDADPEND